MHTIKVLLGALAGIGVIALFIGWLYGGILLIDAFGVWGLIAALSPIGAIGGIGAVCSAESEDNEATD